MARARSWISTHPIAMAVVFTVSLLVLAGGGMGVAKATDSPAFCRSACHEMKPYAAAWDEGPHADVACVECHVNPGTTARLAHKLDALKEVVSHFKGDATFPLSEPASIPNERCVRCHEKVEVTSTGFDHAKHAEGRNCEDCHRTAGHEVDSNALKAAGIYNPRAQARVVESGAATVDSGVANVPGHVAVSCTRCHDLAKTGCSSCHEPRHTGTGPAAKSAECTTCHAAGAKFTFSHPAPKGAVCSSCHQPPAQKHEFTAQCQTCHNNGGNTWAFDHPAKTADCTKCHARPAKHRTGSCTTCHRAGSSWSFRHPTSSACSSCHKAPSKHYGSSCASCHKAGRSWRSATVRHPRIPGGEHTNRSFACSNCHPNGYTSRSCLKCHDSNSPGD